ncbi:uncharacterized protein LOC121667172 isoform X3 [Corvus kubaryi]|uniref:uncharacterized protein LOC121667172 isoform X3 n=1 Tax=Corvus kubaryi TaxID=68294 RepID=UPI001C0537FC|nr:uncharacterized protein LOC121667172 isoform X3 [Corvus kubaryi]
MVSRSWIPGAAFPVVCGERTHPAPDEKAEEEQRNATSGTRCEELRRLLHGPAELRDTAPAFGRDASPSHAAPGGAGGAAPRRRDRADVTRRPCCSGRLAGTLPLTGLRRARGKGRAAPRRGRLSPRSRTPAREGRARPQRRSAAILRDNPNLLHTGTNSSSSSCCPSRRHRPAPAGGGRRGLRRPSPSRGEGAEAGGGCARGAPQPPAAVKETLNHVSTEVPSLQGFYSASVKLINCLERSFWLSSSIIYFSSETEECTQSHFSATLQPVERVGSLCMQHPGKCVFS